MSGSEPIARLTPYELGLPGRAFAERAFAAIREEGAGRGVDFAEPAAFFQLGEVGRGIREIQGEERVGAGIERFAAFLFHAFHFHRGGERLFLLTEPAARALVEDMGWEAAPAGGPQGGPDRLWRGAFPADSGYLQLPRHLFWSQPEGGAPAEPIDGVFWTRSAGDTLSLLVVLGVREERGGFSVMELPPLPLSDAARWVAGGAREEGADFASTLPGGALGRLYSIVTLGEVLALLGRVFSTLERRPEALGEEVRSPGSRPEPSGPGRVVPSALPFQRITWAEAP